VSVEASDLFLNESIWFEFNCTCSLSWKGIHLNARASTTLLRVVLLKNTCGYLTVESGWAKFPVWTASDRTKLVIRVRLSVEVR